MFFFFLFFFLCFFFCFFFFKQKTAYEILTCDWSSDVCSSDLCHCQGNINFLPRIILYLIKRIFYALLGFVNELMSASHTCFTPIP